MQHIGNHSAAHDQTPTPATSSSTQLTLGLGHDFLSILGDAGLLLQLRLEGLDSAGGDQVDLDGLLAPFDDDRVRHGGGVAVRGEREGIRDLRDGAAVAKNGGGSRKQGEDDGSAGCHFQGLSVCQSARPRTDRK